jgi:ABC-type sugar transport system ATPase subunit
MSGNTTTDKAITIRNLVVDYGPRRILNGINLEIPNGQIMVIMGQSGAGKSTLLRCILGLKKPTSGSIHCHRQPH